MGEQVLGTCTEAHSKSILLLILSPCLLCLLRVLLFSEQFQTKDFSADLDIPIPRFVLKLDLLCFQDLPCLLT